MTTKNDLINEIAKCRIEIKALEERDWEKCCQKFKEKLIAENKALKESRDELLEELKLARAGFKSVLIDTAIKKAEALKEKASESICKKCGFDNEEYWGISSCIEKSCLKCGKEKETK